MELNAHAYLCVCVCVKGVCEPRPHRGASGADFEPAVVSYGEKEARRPVSLRPPGALLITAVLPRRCLDGARLKRKKKEVGGLLTRQAARAAAAERTAETTKSDDLNARIQDGYPVFLMIIHP